MGIALHHGEAAYGNVGSRQRLDFTIVGPDVNLTSRVGQLNKVLGEPLLLTAAFADQLWREVKPLGRHMLAGLAEPVLLFKP
jgi:adenylate cyclase